MSKSADLYASGRKGRRYHRNEACTGLNSVAWWGDTIVTVTRKEARERGLQPCAICKPAPLLTALTEARDE